MTKLTNRTLQTKTKQELIRIALNADYGRRCAWRGFFALKEQNEEIGYLQRRINTMLHNPQQEGQTNTDGIDYLVKQMKDLMNEYKHTYNCAICFEDFDSKSSGVLLCGHMFHKDCINKWKETSDKCPHCRKKFTSVL